MGLTIIITMECGSTKSINMGSEPFPDRLMTLTQYYEWGFNDASRIFYGVRLKFLIKCLRKSGDIKKYSHFHSKPVRAEFWWT